MKILAIKFKFLGDVALMTPSLRALKEAFPHAQIHTLTSARAQPIHQNTPWIHKSWGFPKQLSSEAFNTLLDLQNEHFDLSIDFVGNDRGALLSRLINADTKLGPISTKGFLGREYSYDTRQQEAPGNMHEVLRELHLLSKIHIPQPSSLAPELYSDPLLKSLAQQVANEDTIYCHLSTSTQSKEWPIEQWAAFYNEYPELQQRLLFGSGPSDREMSLLFDLKSLIPNAQFIESCPSISQLMAIIDLSQATISCDTFTAHLSAGLRTPTVDIFGPTSPDLWAPLGYTVPAEVASCHCRHFFYKCTHHTHCLSILPPASVYDALNKALKLYGKQSALTN